MKHNFLKSIFLLVTGGILLASTGCKKLEDFDPEVDPNGAVTPITPGLLTSAESSLGGILGGTLTGGIVGGLFAQYWSETQYTESSLYQEPKLQMSGWYAGPLADLQKIINMNTDVATSSSAAQFGSNGNQLAMAKILKAYYIWTITDRWGPVPFSEALQGAGNFEPKYDSQEEIYFGLLSLLEEALGDFDGGQPMQGDIIYSGDVGKWKKLANTLRMFISLRMSNRYPAPGGLAATNFAAAYNDAGSYIQDNSDNLSLPFPGGTYNNSFFSLYESRSDHAISLTMTDILDNLGDDRIQAFASQEQPGLFIGFPYGLSRGDASDFIASVGGNWSRVFDPSLRTQTSILVIVNAASANLAAAEAMALNWLPYNASQIKVLYDRAIIQSYDQWGLSSVDANTYVASAAANIGSGVGGGLNIGNYPTVPSIVGADALTRDTLSRIRLQRYISHFGDGIQGWSEWRRTGVPNLKPTAYATNGGTIPRRYMYATNEYSLNPTGLASGLPDLTPSSDLMTSKMWWDN